MIFTYEELHSSLWAKLTEHYEARLQLLRAKNDNPLTPEETSRLRGRLAEVKFLLSLAEGSTPAELLQYDPDAL